ncbi:hypothetical protein Zmor_006836 [Zophobas morio]|uniref:Uncharacterized protein n=1 Tax=Zophobas morio TaxID=2755281 RepID=A0AA38ISJ7_9CUCU|nr:hypothetical protein Zmor_006836 [Zophobas morio]
MNVLKASHSNSNAGVRLYWIQLVYNSADKQQYTHVATLQLKICDRGGNMSEWTFIPAFTVCITYTVHTIKFPSNTTRLYCCRQTCSPTVHIQPICLSHTQTFKNTSISSYPTQLYRGVGT